jgi:hypothetical protein
VKGLFEEFKSELKSALCRKRNEENSGKEVELLPDRHNAEETVGELSGTYAPKLRLKRGGRITITEEVEAAAGKEENGKEVIALLLNQKGDQITITEEVVKAAVRNQRDAKEVIALLLDRKGNQITISEEVLKAADQNRRNGMEVIALLLDFPLSRRPQCVVM